MEHFRQRTTAFQAPEMPILRVYLHRGGHFTRTLSLGVRDAASDVDNLEFKFQCGIYNLGSDLDC